MRGGTEPVLFRDNQFTGRELQLDQGRHAMKYGFHVLPPCYFQPTSSGAIFRPRGGFRVPGGMTCTAARAASQHVGGYVARTTQPGHGAGSGKGDATHESQCAAVDRSDGWLWAGPDGRSTRRADAELACVMSSPAAVPAILGCVHSDRRYRRRLMWRSAVSTGIHQNAGLRWGGGTAASWRCVSHQRQDCGADGWGHYVRSGQPALSA